MARKTLIQVRRDTAANWTSANPTLAAGEPGFETDTGKLKLGDGTTAWNSLAYLTSDGGIAESILDAKGDIIAATAADTPARLAVGTNGQVLTADSAESTGIKWATPTGGTGIRPYTGIRTGENFYHFIPTVAALSATAPGSTNLRAFPAWLPAGVQIDRLGVECTTGAASSTIRLGIYSPDSDDLPGALLVDGGTVATTTTGNKEVTINQTIPDDGWYWFASVPQGSNSPAFRCYAAVHSLAPVGFSTSPPASTNLGGGGYSHNGAVSGALPNPYVVGSGLPGAVPRVFFRVV